MVQSQRLMAPIKRNEVFKYSRIGAIHVYVNIQDLSLLMICTDSKACLTGQIESLCFDKAQLC